MHLAYGQAAQPLADLRGSVILWLLHGLRFRSGHGFATSRNRRATNQLAVLHRSRRPCLRCRAGRCMPWVACMPWRCFALCRDAHSLTGPKAAGAGRAAVETDLRVLAEI